MPVSSKLAVWEGEGRSLQQLVSFCYDLWTENKSCLKKFFSENEISAVFKTDTDLCEIARSAHFTSVESIGRYKILKSSSKGSTASHKALSEEINKTKKLKIELLKRATDTTPFNVEVVKKTCGTVFLTPCKAANTRQPLTQNLREQIVKKLETEFTESVYTEDDIAEATAKFEKAQKVDMLAASLKGVNVLKDEIESLTALLNKSFKEFIYCFHKKSVPPTFDWSLDLVDSEGILERVAHSMFGSLCNLQASQKVNLHALTVSMKHSLKEYVWFLSIFKDEGAVLSSRKTLESVLSCTLADMFKRDFALAHLTLLPAHDPRVLSGSISQFDFYVEAANLVSRPAAPATGGDSLKKVNFVAGVDNSAGGAANSSQGAEGDRERAVLKDVVLALGKLEKDPQGVCMKEIRTELHSTEVKSLFERIEKGAEKGKEKKKRALRDSSSDSDSSSSESSDSSRKSRDKRPAPKKKVVVDEKEMREKKSRSKAPTTRKRKVPIEVEDDSKLEILHAITKLGTTLSNTLARDRGARGDGDARQGQRAGYTQGREGGYDRQQYRDNRRIEEPRRDAYNPRGREQRDQYREGGGGRFTRATGGLGAPSFPPKTKKGDICDKLFETGKCPDVECRGKHGKCDLRTDRKCNNERDGKCCDWLLTARGCTFRHDDCAPHTKNARRV